MSSRDGALDELEKAFAGRGYVFRHFANGTCEPLRYQAGVIEPTTVIVPASIATGHRAVEVQTECFRLICCAGSLDDLAARLEKLDPKPSRHYRELLDA
jgi:hypothetical protein